MSRLDSEDCKHKEHGRKLYKVWHGMRSRCFNENNSQYYLYGGRGISVCEEWDNDFTKFYHWAINNRFNEELTLDRINVNGNYEPSNCRWATVFEQNTNKRTNKIIEINGIKKTAAEWDKEFGLKKNTVSSRFNHGFTGEDLIRKEEIIKMGGAKLTEEQVIQIVNLLDSGTYKKNQIAEIFGVSYYAVHNIDNGKSWNHITRRRLEA